MASYEERMDARDLATVMADLYGYELIEGELPSIELTAAGVSRVLRGHEHQHFTVKRFTPGAAGWVAHVIDYRHDNGGRPQTWSISEVGYEVVTYDETDGLADRAAEIIAQRAEAAGEHAFAAKVREGVWDERNRADIAAVLKQLQGTL